jgi:hypothetical protein
MDGATFRPIFSQTHPVTLKTEELARMESLPKNDFNRDLIGKPFRRPIKLDKMATLVQKTPPPTPSRLQVRRGNGQFI